MDYAEYRAMRQAEIDAQREALRLKEEAAKPAPSPAPEKKKRDWWWDSYFAGQFH